MRHSSGFAIFAERIHEFKFLKISHMNLNTENDMSSSNKTTNMNNDSVDADLQSLGKLVSSLKVSQYT